MSLDDRSSFVDLMKKPPLSFYLTGTCLSIIFLVVAPLASAITLTGANGRAVEFAGIKDATPKGITAQLTPEADLIGVPWSKLDLAALERDQKLIFAAYKRAKDGETIELNLGSYAENTPADGKPKTAMPKYKGWIETQVGSTEFMIQLPLGKPRGILLLAIGDRGYSFRYVMGHEKGAGPWSSFQNKYDMALMTYRFEDNDDDPTTLNEFAYAEKRSGAAVEAAIESLATKLKNPDLIDLPIAVYGSGQLGASFSYHFTMWKPERVLAAVCSQGAFYDAVPNEAAAAVPILFGWGEYSNVDELWDSENSAEAVLAKHASLKPNWTAGREFRGSNGLSPVLDHFEKSYLMEVVGMRLPERVEEKPEPKEEPEEKTEGEDSETEEEEPEEEKGPSVLPLDRAKGYIGTIKGGETLKIEDPAAEIPEGKTFIPNSKVAQMWKLLVTGELIPPPPPSVE